LYKKNNAAKLFRLKDSFFYFTAGVLFHLVQVVVFASIVLDQNSLLAKPHFILLSEFKDNHSIKFKQWLY
jgi:hypothetical protein